METPSVRSYTKSTLPRMRWTETLHCYFVQVVEQLGGAHEATPKKITLLMNVRGLTVSHVKSHLQMYRAKREGDFTRDELIIRRNAEWKRGMIRRQNELYRSYYGYIQQAVNATMDRKRQEMIMEEEKIALEKKAKEMSSKSPNDFSMVGLTKATDVHANVDVAINNDGHGFDLNVPPSEAGTSAYYALGFKA